jgi:hypothetical protein
LKIKEKVGQFLSLKDSFKECPLLILLLLNAPSVSKDFQKRLICNIILARNMKYAQTAKKE